MEKQTILVAVIAFLIGGIGGYALSEKNDYRGGYRGERMDHSMMYQDKSETEKKTPMGNMMGMDHSAMMVSSEREFIEGMIPHHQEAVDTAKEVIERGGTTPEIKALVENIVVAQEKEIADMKEWYLAWYGEEYADSGEYGHMMSELEGLSGADIDRAFLTDMIPHHMGAIMMARSVIPYIEHEEMTELTNAIVETQMQEIEEMNEMLESLE